MSVSAGEALSNEKVVTTVLPAWVGVAVAKAATSAKVPKRNERLLMKDLLKHEVFSKNSYGSSNLAVQQPWIPVAFGSWRTHHVGQRESPDDALRSSRQPPSCCTYTTADFGSNRKGLEKALLTSLDHDKAPGS